MSDSIVSLFARRAALPALLLASGAVLAHHGQAEIGAAPLEALVASVRHWLTQPDHLLAIVGIGTIVALLRRGGSLRTLLRRLTGR